MFSLCCGRPALQARVRDDASLHYILPYNMPKLSWQLHSKKDICALPVRNHQMSLHSPVPAMARDLGVPAALSRISLKQPQRNLHTTVAHATTPGRDVSPPRTCLLQTVSTRHKPVARDRALDEHGSGCSPLHRYGKQPQRRSLQLAMPAASTLTSSLPRRSYMTLLHRETHFPVWPVSRDGSGKPVCRGYLIPSPAGLAAPIGFNTQTWESSAASDALVRSAGEASLSPTGAGGPHRHGYRAPRCHSRRVRALRRFYIDLPPALSPGFQPGRLMHVPLFIATSLG